MGTTPKYCLPVPLVEINGHVSWNIVKQLSLDSLTLDVVAMLTIAMILVKMWHTCRISVSGMTLFLLHTCSKFHSISVSGINPLNLTSLPPHYIHQLTICSVYIAILCAFMLGFGDACFNTQVSHVALCKLTKGRSFHVPETCHLLSCDVPLTKLTCLQIYSIIGNLYPKDDESAPAMALFKFFQVEFLYSTVELILYLTIPHTGSHWQQW